MEAILGLVLGLVIGLTVGATVIWFVAKSRVGADTSRLETDLATTRTRFDDSERARLELQEEFQDWRQQAIDSGTEVARLQAELDAANGNVKETTQSNADLRKEVGEWRREAGESDGMAVRLQAELDAANGSVKETAQSNIDLRKEVDEWRREAGESDSKAARLQAELDSANKRIAEQSDLEKTLLNQFKVMASDVIDSNNEKFLTVADERIGTLVRQAKSDFALSKDAVSELVKPLSVELNRIETTRAQSEGGLKQQIETLSNSNKALERETRNLSTALKRPEVRGAWGEVQLRRVAELAGMANYCDYEEQVSVSTSDGGADRPDMVVRMPSNRTIVVDAKTPMNAYLQSIESESEGDREALLDRHASQVRARADSLTRKAYWNAFDRSPEFVVMFLPGEFLLQPAIERDPELFDRAMRQKVIIATPNTLMALLKTVEMGWREARLAENAREIQRLGQDLHDRLATYADHMGRVGSSLQTTVNNYNRAVGSFDSRLSVTARRFKELGVPASGDIPEMKVVDGQVRQSSAPLSLPADTD